MSTCEAAEAQLGNEEGDDGREARGERSRSEERGEAASNEVGEGDLAKTPWEEHGATGVAGVLGVDEKPPVVDDTGVDIGPRGDNINTLWTFTDFCAW